MKGRQNPQKRKDLLRRGRKEDGKGKIKRYVGTKTNGSKTHIIPMDGGQEMRIIIIKVKGAYLKPQLLFGARFAMPNNNGARMCKDVCSHHTIDTVA